ncbi:hypothetical protein [Haloferula sp. BvORR071]|uniref:hypothetical protein n=1 Tax=Haloferula sp. BvORR071 TaxID=1396141 RepID=UPI000556BA5D|nr:hypothetical protein [Haloferula sp. BvORR071]
MPSWKYRLLLCAGTLGLATWLGYRAERHETDAAGNNPVTFRSVVRKVMAPKSRTNAIDQLNQIRHGAGRSQLGDREIAECWSIIRGFTLEDVQAGLAEIPAITDRTVRGNNANHILIGMLYYRWTQLDPEAAVQAVIKPENNSFLPPVAAAWAAKDPEAALRWAATTDSEYAQNVFGRAAGRMLFTQDPEHALIKATTDFPKALPGVIEALVERSDTADSRRAVIEQLKALQDPEALDYYMRLFYNRLHYYQSPESLRALLSEIDESGLPPEKLAEAKRNIEGSLRLDAPEEELPAILKAGSTSPEKEQSSAYKTWATAKPEQAAAWAIANNRTDLVAETVKSQAMIQLRAGWQPAKRETGNLWVDVLSPHVEAWQAQDPEAAAAWLKTMPLDVRNHYSKDHATR